MKLLITGGTGFTGSALVRYLLANTRYEIVNVDALTYAASPASLADWAGDPRYVFERANVCDGARMRAILRSHWPDGVIHLAAETHVDRSIDAPAAFVQTNVNGTFALLEAVTAYYHSLSGETRARFRFHHVSTDEVYGSLAAPGRAAETAPYAPTSPYSASKAASDHLVLAWQRTYGLPTVLSLGSNNYGPYQFPEKLVPLIILKAVDGQPLPLYGDGQQVRDWLFVDDHARALRRVFENGQIGERYHIGSNAERTNLALVQTICAELDALMPDPALGARARLITFVADRAGHDRRYALDTSKIRRELGWAPLEDLATGLRRTIRWYIQHPQWCAAARGRGYAGQRLGLTPRPWL